MEITNKNHKSDTIYNWKKRGIIYDDFDALYEVYIKTMECTYCGKDFKNTRDRHLDHDHNTGLFRKIVCNKCNNQDSYIKYPNGYTQEDRKKYERQYSIDNADKKKEYDKQYRIRNADKQKENRKQYYINNKDKIKEKLKENSKEKYTCICGSILAKKTKARHEKTKKHINFLNIL
tara:strand:- start:58 stop:585 length:528 start_codon:yes stop_codon:yes gene_type:complete